MTGELFDQTSEEACVSGDILVSYYLTSIYDHSVLEAFSKVMMIMMMMMAVMMMMMMMSRSCRSLCCSFPC